MYVPSVGDDVRFTNVLEFQRDFTYRVEEILVEDVRISILDAFEPSTGERFYYTFNRETFNGLGPVLAASADASADYASSDAG